ncbi:MAG: hypothetical protein WBR15_02875 [Gammaproteobacteria bacterium]
MIEAASDQQTARVRRKHEFVGVGALIQVVAIIVFLASFMFGIIGIPVGIILALLLFMIGSRMSLKWRCGACGNPVADRRVKMCPTCKVTLK